MLYRFGTFTFDDSTGDLLREGVPVKIEPQPARALAILVSKPGDIVTREELKSAIWGEDVHVDFDRGLAYCMGQVRSALRDSAENPRYLQTLPRRGFRFIAPVERAAPAALEAHTHRVRRVAGVPALALAITALAIGVTAVVFAWRRSQELAARPPIVAVAIFDNETGLAEHDRRVAGMSDVVVARLTQLGADRIGVIGNEAALREPRALRNLKTLGARVDADFIVLGQLQNEDGGLRIVLHLVRLPELTHLWADRFSPLPARLGAAEEDAARRVEAAVRRHVLAE